MEIMNVIHDVAFVSRQHDVDTLAKAITNKTTTFFFPTISTLMSNNNFFILAYESVGLSEHYPLISSI